MKDPASCDGVSHETWMMVAAAGGESDSSERPEAQSLIIQKNRNNNDQASGRPNEPDRPLLGFLKKRNTPDRAPFPEAWKAVLDRNVPYARGLDAAGRLKLEDLVRTFLKKKRFEGCAGLEVTDEIRVTVAGQACFLLLGRGNGGLYPVLRTVLLYPDAFVSPVVEHLEDGPIVSEEFEERVGESWSFGTVILSWADVLEGVESVNDGYNPVFHEFAHQLDLESGAEEGMPALPDRSAEEAWRRVMTRAYNAVAAGDDRVLDGYAGTSPAEFFAVATETFFEKPAALKRRHPEVYGLLRDYFGQDPERNHL
jgi:MtfA peptidase